MRTCWVLDHPAHVRLLAPLMREGGTPDLIVACERDEVRRMIETGDGRLPRRQTLWVPRPVGDGRYRKAMFRVRSVQRFIKGASKDGQGEVERVVSVGAPLELLGQKSRFWRRTSVKERWYITDTEVNHTAHNLALKGATHVVVPTHWREDLDGGFDTGLVTDAASGDEFYRISYRRRTSIDSTLVTYMSQDLKNWFPAPMVVEEVIPEEGDTGFETVILRSTFPLPDERVFFEVRTYQKPISDSGF